MDFSDIDHVKLIYEGRGFGARLDSQLCGL